MKINNVFFHFVVFIICINYLYADNNLMSKYSQKYVTYAYLANRIYVENDSTLDKIRTIFNEKWKLVNYISKRNGFQAGVYENIDTKTYILAVGGTTANPKKINKIAVVGGDVLDILTDLRLLSNIWPDSQSKSALDYYNDMKRYYKLNSIVGHSLGGGLAAYIGLYANIKTYTFNPSPVPFTRDSFKPFISNYAITLPNGSYKKNKEFRVDFTHSDKITNIMSGNDPVSNISFLLENTDNQYYNAKNSITKWNIVKFILALPKEVHLDYANIGKNIWLPIETSHSMEAMLHEMIKTKKYDDYSKYISKWGYLDKKVRKLENLGFSISNSFYKGKILDYNFPSKKAIEYYAITNMRVLFNSISKSLGKNEYYRYNKSFLIFLGLTPSDNFTDIDNGISYYKYMTIANTTYKKLFGVAFMVKKFIKSKNKPWYKIYSRFYASLVSSDKKTLYRNIFLLHFVGGIPKKYLKNDTQEINNAFMINFFYRFYKNIVRYRDIKLGKLN